MKESRKKKFWRIIAIITSPVWGVIAIALIYLVILIAAIVLGVMSLFNKELFSVGELDFSDLDF